MNKGYVIFGSQQCVCLGRFCSSKKRYDKAFFFFFYIRLWSVLWPVISCLRLEVCYLSFVIVASLMFSGLKFIEIFGGPANMGHSVKISHVKVE